MGDRPRTREFGIHLGLMERGKMNAITDVRGVGVGHSTLICGENVRTGVTAIVPHQGDIHGEKVAAGVDLFNAFGKVTGLPQVMLEGVIEVPILLTETMNTWRVADAMLDYQKERYGNAPRTLNVVVGETNGGYLTDNHGRQIGRKQVFEAIDTARSGVGTGPVPEGNVGGGTPMTGYGFKGGIGTASRIYHNFTVGVLVQLNCGRKEDLMIDGVPVGREVELPEPPNASTGNSIMMVVATDLALDSRQLQNAAKRAMLGLSKTGTFGANTSGDFTIAFSTGIKPIAELIKLDPELWRPRLGERFMNPVYRATGEAIQEAVLNALFKAETMIGMNGNTRHALPLDQVSDIFSSYGRHLKPIKGS